MNINLHRILAKFLFKLLNPFPQIKIMCKGYNEDFVNFTELVWEDDKSLNFFDLKSYPEFQMWV